MVLQKTAKTILTSDDILKYIEDYESMELDEIKDVVCSLVDNIGKAKVSVGIKIYGINDKNKVLKETTILT